MNKYLLSISFILFFYKGSVQSLNNNELHYLHSTIALFMQNQEEKTELKERGSEFIFCMLVIDSNGRVDKIQLLADDKTKDLTFQYLKYLEPSLFTRIFKKCKKKLIVIPMVSFTINKTPEYIKSLMDFYNRMPRSIINETNNVIVTSLLQYNTPHIIKESPEEVKKIESDQ